ncbi:unnamed protein product, partial [Vitis vinifera]
MVVYPLFSIMWLAARGPDFDTPTVVAEDGYKCNSWRLYKQWSQAVCTSSCACASSTGLSKISKLAARADLHHLGLFLQGRQADAPQEALQVLDIPLGEGLESWRGFYQSIRPTQMGLSLNIDMSSTAFIEPLPVIDFVTQLLNRDVSSRPLSDADRVKVKKALRGVKVEVTHRGNMRRKYRISGLTSQATRELTFPVDDRGTVKSVFEYFYETYGFVIQHSQWPCLQVGNQQRPNYLPMETIHHNAYHEDPYAKEFGIKISEKLASWNMMNKKMFAQMCYISGMAFNPEPVLPPITARPDQVERVLKARFHEAMTKLQPQGKELDLLIVILPDNNGSLYGDLKRICETDLGLVSQCCLHKHVYRMSKQYLANVALRINVKVGGRNTVLVDAISRRIPLVSDRPTIIFGADVTHPHPGEDSSPSIVANCLYLSVEQLGRNLSA